MIKKIFVGVLLAGVFGLLVLGAVNRTLAKSSSFEPLALSEGNQRGNGTEGGYRSGELLNQLENYTGQGKNNNGMELKYNSQESKDGLVRPGGNSNGGAGLGQGGGHGSNSSESLGVGLANVEIWENPITVIVDSLSSDLIVVSNDEGFQLEIEGRTLSYMVENNFQISEGDALVLIGFYDNDKYEIGSVTNSTTGQSMDIRDATGRPLWAGRGRGNTTLP